MVERPTQWLAQVAVGARFGRGSTLTLGGRTVALSLSLARMADAAVEALAPDDNPFDAALSDAALARAGIEELFALAFGHGAVRRLNQPLSKAEESWLRPALVRTLRVCAVLRWRGALGQPLVDGGQHDEAAAAQTAAARARDADVFRFRRTDFAREGADGIPLVHDLQEEVVALPWPPSTAPARLWQFWLGWSEAATEALGEGASLRGLLTREMLGLLADPALVTSDDFARALRGRASGASAER